MPNLSTQIRKNSPLLVLFFLVSFGGFAQPIDVTADLLLADTLAKKQIYHSEKRMYIFNNQPKTFKNSNPVSLVYGGVIYIYQNYFSKHFSADCLYDPSCSEFSKRALKEFGVLKGGLLTVDRLSRCNRIAATDLKSRAINPTSQRFSDSIAWYK
jgi:putative membrane protein insertion efficiency factor